MINIDENNNVIDQQSYRGILVGLAVAGEDISSSMDELRGLAEAAGIEPLGELVQNADRVNSATFIGSGKLGELAQLCGNMGADIVVFNDELSGMQLRNIEEACGVRVIDRTILILDIFAERAVSREGKLQVELAQLQYRLPRLLGFGKSLSRLGGGIGTRGPGEKKLETDRRHIQRRMDEIRREMEEVRANRSVQRARRERSQLPVAALVGYTNAGKSSMMNRLLEMCEKTDKQVFEKDMLFATLDTAQRLVRLDDRHSFILVDTVGFVSKLPHALVNAFKATLEEVTEADVLIHVVDSCSSDADFNIAVTQQVLKELSADGKPSILVFNKCDRPDSVTRIGYGKDSLMVSCKTGKGFDELLERLRQLLFSDLELVKLLIPFSRGDIVSRLCDKASPKVLEYREDGTYMEIELGAADRGICGEFVLK